MKTLMINCPHCQVTNRLPAERLADAPRCGKCKQNLFTGKPLELTTANVQATLVNNDIPVLVDCWAPWCGPCRSFAPVFMQAASILEPEWRLAKLDTEAFPALAGQWNIRSIPTLIVFKGGKEIQRLSGALSLPQLQQWLQQVKV
jgi:thioredoxin 2